MDSNTTTFVKTFVQTVVLGIVILSAVSARHSAPMTYLSELLQHPFAASSWAQAADLSPMMGSVVTLASPTGTVNAATTRTVYAKVAAAEAAREACSVVENAKDGEVLFLNNGVHARALALETVGGKNPTVRVQLTDGAYSRRVVYVSPACIKR